MLVLPLNLLPVGHAAVIQELELSPAVEHHLMHMGFSPDSRVTAVRRAPAGDPTVYAIDGMEIALRRETARGILVKPVVESLEPLGSPKTPNAGSRSTSEMQRRQASARASA